MQISIVVPVRDQWHDVAALLESLEQQRDPPRFEVVLVDDGSRDPAPAGLRRGVFSFPVRGLRLPALGVAAARGRGAAASRGEAVFFLHPGCRLHQWCLNALAAAMAGSPAAPAFQARISGDCRTLAGRVAEAAIAAAQMVRLLPDQRIRWFEASGLAIRNDAAGSSGAHLENRPACGPRGSGPRRMAGEAARPLFVAEAIVYRRPPATCVRYLAEAMRTGRSPALPAEGHVGPRLSLRECAWAAGRLWRERITLRGGIAAAGLLFFGECLRRAAGLAARVGRAPAAAPAATAAFRRRSAAARPVAPQAVRSAALPAAQPAVDSAAAPQAPSRQPEGAAAASQSRIQSFPLR